ncbi:MAG: hypothetical protein EAX90_01335 [Candidatus Heimdallarchaeota archaeon]|nr:hypothetical protein [Candidatus Heimdallarchaeota archaeon]
MLSFSNTNPTFSDKKKSSLLLQKNDEKDCFMCKIMKIKNDKADIVEWIFSSNKTSSEKAKLASLFTGIEFDEEIIACIEDPSVNQFLFSK